MLEKIEAYCFHHKLFHKGDTLVIACSGGPDSLALLDVLARLSEPYGLQLIVCYIHHGLRQAADAEVDFVRHEAEARHCLFTWHRVDVPLLAAQRHESEETVGRTERYRFLRQVAAEHGAAAIAVAHHQGDQAETVLLHLLRGSGLQGLTGMKPCSDGIIRPFLCVTRQEIEAYNTAHNLYPCEDETNQSLAYTRNRIRLALLPELKKYNPAVIADLNRLAEVAAADEAFLQQATQTVFNCLVGQDGNTYTINKEKLLSQPLAIQRRLVRSLFQAAGGDGMPIPYHYTEQLLVLAGKPTGHQFSGQQVLVQTTYEELVFAPLPEEKPTVPQSAEDSEVAVCADGTYQLGDYMITIRTATDCPEHVPTGGLVFDKSCCSEELTLRFRRSGDTIHIGMPPLGKSIKKYFIDQKIPALLRNSIPLLCQGSEVLWICGYVGNSRFLASPTTKKYLICTVTGGNCHA